jgi:hypothetical protein
VFNFSSASHSLLSVFRSLSGAHGAAIAAKSKEAVAEQVALLLPQAQQLGAVCVPTLPAEVRDPYAKQVLVVQGLVALTSAVARNVTAMLQQVGELVCKLSAATSSLGRCEVSPYSTTCSPAVDFVGLQGLIDALDCYLLRCCCYRCLVRLDVIQQIATEVAADSVVLS